MNRLSDQRKLVFAKLPGLILNALREFKRMTGFIAVTALPAAPLGADTRKLTPPVHPRCVKALRKTPHKPPCQVEWRDHIRVGHETLSCLRHTCPLGLHCACVPILLGDQLLGLAKFVSGPEITHERFGSTVDLLELIIARPCQELHAVLLQEENHALRIAVDRLQRTKPSASVARDSHALPGGPDPDHPHSASHRDPIIQVLDYLNEHFTDRELSLTHIAREVRKNEKYLTHLFARRIGEKMRSYITALRIRRACELLMGTKQGIKQIAHDSGFTNPVQFRNAFRRNLGITPTEYRHIFAPDA